MPFETPAQQEEEETVETLQSELAEIDARLAELKTRMPPEQQRELDELEKERPNAPKQPGWEEAPDIRKALRNMRGTEAIENWYRYSRKSFYNEQLTQSIMQGVWNEVRKSDKFDSGFKEDMRVMKRQYIMYSGDLTLGFDPNVTKALHETHGYELDELRSLANKRLTELGPDGERPHTQSGGPLGNYFDNYDGDFIDKGKMRNIGREYQALIAAHNQVSSKKQSDGADTRERIEVRFKAGFTMFDDVSQNLADNEFTLMPGSLRGLYVVMRNMDENKLQHYRDRDLDVKIPMVNFFIEQFRDEILGVRNAAQQNLELFTWFVNKAGQNFIPFSSIREDLKDWYEIIKALVGRPRDARVQPSIYPKIQDDSEKRKGRDAAVMRRINELRRERGLPAMDAQNHPFARIGVVK
ncbi:MAG TPA: hypothetical protein DEP25_02915 [Candidatus Taylorbacteria bacterium]|nr:hypothetical protein [Candidatus Taylorbacteria bacterium]